MSGRRFYPQARAILQVVFDGFGDTARDTAPKVIPVLPKAVAIVRNSYSQADSWELVFDAGDLPIDPSLIRSGAAEIYLFQLSEIEQRVVDRRDPLSELDNAGTTPRDPVDTALLGAAALAGAAGFDGTASGIRGRMARDRFTYDNRPSIVGLFDRSSLTLSQDGRWVSINGQDYTAHLISLQWPPLPNGRARRIPVGKRLDETLADMLAEADPLGRLQVALRGVEADELPIVGANGVRSHRRGIPIGGETNYWEVMYKTATRYGFILYVDGLDVVLAKPRNLDEDAAGRIKRLAWGVNLDTLELSREHGKEQSPTIVVRSYDATSRQLLEVEYPEGEYRRAYKAGDKGKTWGNAKQSRGAATTTTQRTSKKGKVSTTIRNRDEYQIIPVHGVTDPVALRRIAETYYHLRGRAERRVVPTTRDLRDMRESDLLTLSAGDAVMIEWDDFNRAVMTNPNLSQAEKLDHLVGRGFNTEVAAAIVDAYDRLRGLERPLRFKEGTIRYDADQGVTIEMDLQDFMVIEGIRDPQSARPGAAARVRDRTRGPDGKPLGWSPEREAAERRRRGAL